jgi:thioredoxin reductase (NADPH)
VAQRVLLAVDNDREILTAMQRDLTRRFAADYRIVTADTPEAAFAELEVGDQVALVMAGGSLRDTTGVDFLNSCHQLHPAAKRLLLITYGDIGAGRAGVRAMALGLLDDYLNKPWGDPELELYPVVSELLSQRARAAVAAGSQPVAIRVVGPQRSARSHELRDLLTRNSVAHSFYDVAQPEGRQLLRQAGVAPGDQPIVLLFDGRVLVDPPNDGIAEALGVQTKPANTHYDLAVIGGGPAGLTAAMYAASEGLATLVLDAKP